MISYALYKQVTDKLLQSYYPKSKRAIIILSLLIVGCTSFNLNSVAQVLNQAQNKQLVYTDTMPTDVDTSQYAGLGYWNSTLSQSGEQGYIDTFSIGNNRFRVIHNNNLFNGVIEKRSNGKWIHCFEVELGNHNSYSLADVNGDGYKDFLHSWKWFSEVYFFDPKKKNFTDTVSASVSLEWTLLDSTRKIFCDFNEGKQLCNHIYSTLYTFHGFKRYNLFHLKMYNCDGGNSAIITKLILSRCINGYHDSLHTIEQTILNTPINIEDKRWQDSSGNSTYFDYATYWKRKYKKLLPLTNKKVISY